MKMIYFIGPYQSDPKKWTDRMCDVTRIVTQSDHSHEFTILAPHPMIYHGGYGEDGDAIQRSKGMTQTLNLLMIVATNPSSELWVMLDDNDQYSQGTEMEIDMWKLLRGPDQIHELRYDQWIQYLEMVWQDE